ncbi:hypothetical protein CYMTET_19993, partial [Cymbomonas tetramitiformis]
VEHELRELMYNTTGDNMFYLSALHTIAKKLPCTKNISGWMGNIPKADTTGVSYFQASPTNPYFKYPTKVPVDPLKVEEAKQNAEAGAKIGATAEERAALAAQGDAGDPGEPAVVAEGPSPSTAGETSIAVDEKSESVAETAPAEDTSATVPAEDSSSAVPAEDSSSAVPAEDSSSVVPAEDSSSAVPAEDASAPVPAEDSSAAVPAEDAGTGLASSESAPVSEAAPDSADTSTADKPSPVAVGGAHLRGHPHRPRPNRGQNPNTADGEDAMKRKEALRERVQALGLPILEMTNSADSGKRDLFWRPWERPVTFKTNDPDGASEHTCQGTSKNNADLGPVGEASGSPASIPSAEIVNAHPQWGSSEAGANAGDLRTNGNFSGHSNGYSRKVRDAEQRRYYLQSGDFALAPVPAPSSSYCKAVHTRGSANMRKKRASDTARVSNYLRGHSPHVEAHVRLPAHSKAAVRLPTHNASFLFPSCKSRTQNISTMRS